MVDQPSNISLNEVHSTPKTVERIFDTLVNTSAMIQAPTLPIRFGCLTAAMAQKFQYNVFFLSLSFSGFFFFFLLFFFPPPIPVSGIHLRNDHCLECRPYYVNRERASIAK